MKENEKQREVIEFVFSCNRCGQRVVTRTDDNTSVKGCPRPGCKGDMLYVSSRELSPEELEKSALYKNQPTSSGRIIGL